MYNVYEWKIEKLLNTKSNLRETSFMHFTDFLTFLLFVFIEKQLDISAS